MSISLSYGPNGTAVGGVSDVNLPTAPLNYLTDFRRIDGGGETGKVVYTDLTAPTDRPATLRIQASPRSNIYAGTSIDPSVYFPSKKGTDLVIEVKEVWAKSDSADLSFVQQAPVRAALTLNLPSDELVTIGTVKHLVSRLVAALAAQGEADLDDGLTALLHGVYSK